MSNNKQSSVEWLVSKIDFMLPTYLIEQAKAMHNEEIENSHKHGFSEGVVFGTSPIGYKYITSEDYYNEIYGGNNESN
jgi:hypothetical protein